jgi:hypothetical protein
VPGRFVAKDVHTARLRGETSNADFAAMSTTPPPDGEIFFEATSDVYDPSDERWQTQVDDLRATLEANVGPVSQNVTPVAGRKGGISEIVLALGSAGAITAAVEVFKYWLNRDKSRRIRATVTNAKGEKETVEIDGDNVSNEIVLAMINRPRRK